MIPVSPTSSVSCVVVIVVVVLLLGDSAEVADVGLMLEVLLAKV